MPSWSFRILKRTKRHFSTFCLPFRTKIGRLLLLQRSSEAYSIFLKCLEFLGLRSLLDLNKKKRGTIINVSRLYSSWSVYQYLPRSLLAVFLFCCKQLCWQAERSSSLVALIASDRTHTICHFSFPGGLQCPAGTECGGHFSPWPPSWTDWQIWPRASINLMPDNMNVDYLKLSKVRGYDHVSCL